MRSSTHSRFSLTCKKLNSLKQLSSVAVIMLKDFFHINGFNICRQSRVEKKNSGLMVYIFMVSKAKKTKHHSL